MATLRIQVAERAQWRCEYCRLPDAFDLLPFQLDHIIAQKHHGPTSIDNLAWACVLCNSFKSCNLAGFDPTTEEIVRLFHPRRERWDEHFEWDGPSLVGLTTIGRITVDVLEINLRSRVEHRRLLRLLGDF